MSFQMHELHCKRKIFKCNLCNEPIKIEDKQEHEKQHKEGTLNKPKPTTSSTTTTTNSNNKQVNNLKNSNEEGKMKKTKR